MKFRKKKESLEKIVTDENGVTRKFHFNLIDYTPRNSRISACNCCPYFRKCDKFPYPGKTDNKILFFEDYCCTLKGEGEWIPIPEEGTIEEAGLKFRE